MPADYRFDTFELQASARRLLRDGASVKLGGRAFDLLLALIERRDRVVAKAELLDVVWPRLVVEENNLQVQVTALRRLLGPAAIATVPGRGYRFTATVHGDGATAGAADTRAAPAAEPCPHLIGREGDIAALCAQVQAARLVTVLGAGGVGKSSLARAATRELATGHAEGVCWVDLTPVGDAAGVVPAIAAATRTTLMRGDARLALAAALAGARLLLVLDNAEHLADEVALVAQALLDKPGALHVLVTSQAPLRLTAERLYRLEPLPVPAAEAGLDAARASPAVQLFVARVRASDRHFVLDEHNAAAVVSVTRRLDGLPLAIELAAARVPALAPAQLDDALRDRFRLLSRGDPTAPPRQQTLHAAMQWTHGLLRDAEQRVFRRLAVFVGSFSLPAAQRVCSDATLDEWSALDALTVLVDLSLVAPPQGVPPRYRLLDTPHAYARRLLAESGEEAATRLRHLDVYRDFFVAAWDDHLRGHGSVPQQLALTAPEGDNGLAALAWAIAHDHEAAFAIAPGLAQALARRHPERYAVWQRTEPLFRDDFAPTLRARWQLGWAHFWNQNSLQRCLPHARAAAALFRVEGHAAGEYRAQALLATEVAGVAIAGTREALRRLTELEDPAWPADLRFLRQYAELTHLTAAERYDDALRCAERCLELTRESGRGGRLLLDVALVYIEILAGRLDAAIAHGTQAVARKRQRQPRAPASGMEILVLAARLLNGEAAAGRDLGPSVWNAGTVFNQHGAVAELLGLLAALESRPRAAMLLSGYAEAAYQRGGMQRLAVYRMAGERARELAARQLDAAALAQLHARGAALSDGSIGAIAFATNDAH